MYRTMKQTRKSGWRLLPLVLVLATLASMLPVSALEVQGDSVPVQTGIAADDLPEEAKDLDVPEEPREPEEPDATRASEDDIFAAANILSREIERHQTAWRGTAAGELGLPERIDGQAVSWTSSPGYDPQTPGLYIFTADNDEKTVICVLTRSPMQPAAYGLGTEAVPLEVCTAQQLAEIAVLMNEDAPEGYIDVSTASIKLTADIDLSGLEWMPIGTNANCFQGSFDGNGYVIRNLTIRNATQAYQGLFGYIGGGTVQNLGMEDVKVTTSSNYVGGIAGEVADSGSISGCYMTGMVSGGDYVGGVVGSVQGSSVSDCYVAGSSSGRDHVGGIAGFVDDGSVSGCYVTGSVSGSDKIGGIVGWSSGRITNNVALNADVTGTGSNTGRVAGIYEASGHANNYAWAEMEINGAAVSTGTGDKTSHGADASTAQIAGGSAFWTDSMGFAAAVWSIEDDKLPILQKAGGRQTGDISGHISGHIMEPVTSLEGDGSSTTPYKISSAAELQYMAEQINSSNADYVRAYYHLTTDLDLYGLNWTPIGREFGISFQGSFDGKGHVIRNLTIRNTTEGYQGLFGFIDGGTVQNLGLENVDIHLSGGRYMGGVAGEVDNGSISACYVTGTVSGDSHVGGIAGHVFNSNVSACYAAASVSGSGNGEYVGGVAGYVWGRLNSGTVVEYCYTTGTVSGNDYVGGVVGFFISSSVTNNIALNPGVTAADNIGRVAGNRNGTLNCNYAWTEMTVNGTAVSTSTGEGTIHGANAETAAILNGSIWGSSYLDFDTTVWTIEAGRLPMLKGVGSQDGAVPTYIKGLEKDAQGVYLIQSVADLEYMAQKANEPWGTEYRNAAYRLTTDLDLSGIAWTPIGTEDYHFRGAFDGSGKVIRNLTIQNNTSAYQGLFAYIHGGTVKDLILEDVEITTSKNYVGGIAGYLSNSGSVEGCSVTGFIIGGSTVGGIAGRVSNVGVNGSSVKNCFVAAQCSGKDSVGGIAGYVNGSDVAYCYATGSVVGTGAQIGGIAGYLQGGTAENCYATGNVTGTGDYVGGIVGNMSGGNITNSYAIGDVNGGAHAGGIAGFISSSSAVENCYTTGSVSGSNNVGGIVGYNNASTIKDCATLGAFMYAANGVNVSRIVYHENTNPVIENNYAFEGMTLTSRLGNPTADGNHGEDVTGRKALSADFWEGLGFDTLIWTLEDGYLPALQGVGGSQQNTGGLYLGIFPQLEGEVSISGQAVVGETLKAVTQQEGESTLSAFPRQADAGLGDLSYVWYRNEVLIEGAQTERYLLTQADSGMQITVSVSSEHTSGWVTSLPSDSVSDAKSIGGSSSGSGSAYIVTFHTNGGSSVNSQRVSYNGTVKKPADPTREGYAFSGWYTDPGLTVKYDFTSKVKKSFTLYAGWEEVSEEPNPGDYEHVAYINGYADGTFQPNNTLTRAEAAMLFYNLMDDGISAGSYASDFSDVASSAWYYEAVMELAGRGIIGGYANGSFRPDEMTTRAEFVTIALRFTGLDSKEGAGEFSDITESHWAAMYIARAAAAGYISGYPDGTFHPDESVSRAEAVSILNRIVGCKGLHEGNTFTDVPQSHWAYEAITGAATGHDHD